MRIRRPRRRLRATQPSVGRLLAREALRAPWRPSTRCSATASRARRTMWRRWRRAGVARAGRAAPSWQARRLCEPAGAAAVWREWQRARAAALGKARWGAAPNSIPGPDPDPNLNPYPGRLDVELSSRSERMRVRALSGAELRRAEQPHAHTRAAAQPGMRRRISPRALRSSPTPSRSVSLGGSAAVRQVAVEGALMVSVGGGPASTTQRFGSSMLGSAQAASTRRAPVRVRPPIERCAQDAVATSSP